MALGGGFSNSTKAAAILAAIAPIVAGVYQQGEEARQREAQRREQQQQLSEKKAAADKEADVSTARALQEGLAATGTSAADFCSRLYFAATQLSGQAVSTRTRNTLYAALRLRETDGERLRVCGCAAPSRIGGWLEEVQQLIPPEDGGSAVDRLSQAVRSAAAECATAMTEVEQLRHDLQEAQEQLARLSVGGPVVGSAPAPAGDDGAVAATPPPLPAPEAAPAPGPQAGQEPGPAPAEAPAEASVSAPEPAPVTSAPPPLTAAASEASPRCAVAPPDDARRRRVFIQVPDADVRAQAERLRGGLNDSPPFTAPAIEVVGPKRAPARYEVRYTYAIDESAARQVQQALADCLQQPARLVVMDRYRGRTDSGVIEVWWPRSPLSASEVRP